MMRIMAGIMLLGSSCSKSETVDPTDPNAQLPDPSGTVTLSMRNANSGKTFLADSYVYIDKADNFTGGTFVSLGQVRGLGNVSYIPKTGWVSSIAVVPGEGYVAYSSGKFYRIYVTGYTMNISNEIIGAEVKYQAPFGGLDEAVRVPETSLTFDAGGETKEILFANESVIPCTVTTEGDCRASLLGVSGYSFLPQGVRIEMEANGETSERQGKVIIRATNGHTTEINIVQRGAGPYISLGNDVSLDCAAQVKTIEISTNLSKSDLTVTSDTDWCNASLEPDGALCLNVAENTTAKSRTATVVVSSKDGKIKEDLKVLQDMPSISLDKGSSIEISAAAETINVSVTSGSSQWTVTSDKDWCTVMKSGASFEIAVDENNDGMERSATVTARVNEAIGTSIVIKQSKHTFSLSAEELDFDRQMQNASITLETTASEVSAVSSDPSWCSLSWNDKIMTVRVMANDTQQNRVATITVRLLDNQFKTIQVAQSRYMVGDYYLENGVEGVVFLAEGEHGKLLSMDGSHQQWSIETVDIGATDPYDGMVNMDQIRQIPNWQTFYPAFAWCEAKNTNGVTGWYLPASSELSMIMRNRSLLNGTLNNRGGEAIFVSSSIYYWSSTQSSSDKAYGYQTSLSSAILKTKYNSVRAVRAF